MTTKKILVTLKEYLIITFGLSLFAFAYVFFLLPHNIVGGGVSGAASILQYATNGAIKVSVSYFLANAVLVTIAILTLGRSFGVKTVYAIIVSSLMLHVLQTYVPQNLILTYANDSGKLVSTVVAGLLIGVGIGISISQGGSTGGTDIIGLLVSRRYNISPGKVIMYIDICIIISSLFIPSYKPTGDIMSLTEKITSVVYSFILIWIDNSVLDLYLSGAKQSVQLFVLSSKFETIADTINNDLHRGVTVIDGQGWYTKKPVKVLMVLTRKTDVNLYLKTIKEIDPKAFISVASVSGVYGEGFEKIKGDAKK